MWLLLHIHAHICTYTAIPLTNLSSADELFCAHQLLGPCVSLCLCGVAISLYSMLVL